MSDLPIHLFNIRLFDTQSVGVGTNYSQAVDLQTAISYSVQINVTNDSGLVGTIYLEASNDGLDFIEIDQTLLPIDASAKKHMINIEKPSYAYFRLVVSISAGSCDIKATTNGKRQ